MTYTLGIDIGTFESKGALVDAKGEIVNSAARPHKMIVPRPGWAEHRANEDWWDDLTHITRWILKETGIPPGDIRAIACSAIGPCMLPVDAAGTPLMNAVLYGVDGRAGREVAELTERIPRSRSARRSCGLSGAGRRSMRRPRESLPRPPISCSG
jgi:xylulokinase